MFRRLSHGFWHIRVGLLGMFLGHGWGDVERCLISFRYFLEVKTPIINLFGGRKTDVQRPASVWSGDIPCPK